MGRSHWCSPLTIGPRVSDRRRAFLPYLALASLALVWGISFLLIKVAVKDMSPAVLLLLRSASGCIALAVIVLAMSIGMCAVSGFFAVKKVKTADPADLF